MEFDAPSFQDAFVSLIRRNVTGKDVAIALSGGLDSGLVTAIAKEYANSVVAYTCGTTDSFDVAMAKDAAERLGVPWVHCVIDEDNIESLILEMIEATGVSDPFTISYELQLFTVCKTAKEKLILSGQGADEYFMGCAKFVDIPDEDYLILRKDAIDRLINVSVPCELTIAKHFEKELLYPYIEESVSSIVTKTDPLKLKPKDMDSRKSELKEVATSLGYGFLADRKKKSSQYGSKTTDLIRLKAKANNLMFNKYIASLYDDAISSKNDVCRGESVRLRVDASIKAKAENVLRRNGMTASQAVEIMYRKIAEEGISFLSDSSCPQGDKK